MEGGKLFNLNFGVIGNNFIIDGHNERYTSVFVVDTGTIDFPHTQHQRWVSFVLSAVCMYVCIEHMILIIIIWSYH